MKIIKIIVSVLLSVLILLSVFVLVGIIAVRNVLDTSNLNGAAIQAFPVYSVSSPKTDIQAVSELLDFRQFYNEFYSIMGGFVIDQDKTEELVERIQDGESAVDILVEYKIERIDAEEIVSVFNEIANSVVIEYIAGAGKFIFGETDVETLPEEDIASLLNKYLPRIESIIAKYTNTEKTGEIMDNIPEIIDKISDKIPEYKKAYDYFESSGFIDSIGKYKDIIYSNLLIAGIILIIIIFAALIALVQKSVIKALRWSGITIIITGVMLFAAAFTGGTAAGAIKNTVGEGLWFLVDYAVKAVVNVMFLSGIVIFACGAFVLAMYMAFNMTKKQKKNITSVDYVEQNTL